MRKLTESHFSVFISEYIGDKSETEGTETSKYLEEKKAKAIPLVVASERGTAQTPLTGVLFTFPSRY